MAQKRTSGADVRNFCASFLGGLVGAFLFLVFATYFFGHPFGDWFMSAHGIFSADKQAEISEQDNIEIYKLLSRGLIVSSDGIISNLTDLYGNMIQVLIGLLAAATVLAFFAVRWQSVQSAQEYVDGKTNSFFESTTFKDLVAEKSREYIDQLDPATNPQVRTEAVAEDLMDLRSRIETVELHIRNAASPEEQSEPEEQKVERPRPGKRDDN